MTTTGLEPTPFRHEYVPCGGTSIAVALLPGLFAGAWIWDATSARLQQEGFGTIRWLEPLAAFDWAGGSLENLRLALRAVLDECSVDRATLCGNSLGGLVALDFARHHPDRIRSLVVSGAPGLEPEINLGLGTPRHVTREFLVRLAEKLFHDPRRITEDMIERTLEGLSERRQIVNVARALKTARDYPIRDVLPRIRSPVLLIWGENDTVTPVASWEPWARRLPTVALRTIPQCGHSPMLERPDVFNAVMLDHLRGGGER